jgi:F-type H+-transporting ATPase subunit delta
MVKFSELYDKRHGIVLTQVRGRADVSQDVLEKVREFVKNRYDAKEVEIDFVVDEKIKGGIVIQVGDEVIDASVATQLRMLKKELVK